MSKLMDRKISKFRLKKLSILTDDIFQWLSLKVRYQWEITVKEKLWKHSKKIKTVALSCRGNYILTLPSYSKTCLKWPLKKMTKIVFQDRLPLNAGQKYCRMLQESILQYFWPSLGYHLSLRPLFCLCLNGRLRQVLLFFSQCLSLMIYWVTNHWAN